MARAEDGLSDRWHLELELAIDFRGKTETGDESKVLPSCLRIIIEIIQDSGTHPMGCSEEEEGEGEGEQDPERGNNSGTT